MMSSARSQSEPCFSMHVVQPFIEVLRQVESFPKPALDQLEALGPTARIPVRQVLELLRGAILLTGDEALGLRAARASNPGAYDVLEYAASTCKSGREAFDVISRYIRLLNDAAQVSYREHEGRIVVHLGSSVPLSRAATDFYVAAFHVAHRFRATSTEPFEVWFEHDEPSYRDEYEQTFVKATFRFGAPFNAFLLERDQFDRELDTADPELNQVLRRHAEALLAGLPRGASLTERVRAVIATTLPGGANAEAAAAALAMSRRSLTRHLDREGTSFRELLDDMRRRMAMRYLEQSELSPNEIAFLLGFAHVGAFHRAFKRWSELTPLEYRRTQR